MLLTVNSTGRVLGLFSVDAAEWGPTEMAGALGMSKSKAHSLLASMADVGLLRRTPRGRYRLGWRLLGLHRVLADSTDFQRFARPVMGVLCAHLGETVHLGVMDAGQVMYVDRSQATGGVRIAVSAVGMQMPMHCTGIGKMLLAGLAEDELESVVREHPLTARTRKTITDVDTLMVELDRIRERGIAFDREECLAEISCVAAPIRGPGSATIAAISIMAPTFRFVPQERRLEAAVRKAADHVSRRVRESSRAIGELDATLC